MRSRRQTAPAADVQADTVSFESTRIEIVEQGNPTLGGQRAIAHGTRELIALDDQLDRDVRIQEEDVVKTVEPFACGGRQVGSTSHEANR